nr:NifU family protein [Euzebyales bacterium]
MTASSDLRGVGDRVGALLDQLGADAGPAALQGAEELVRLLMEVYGSGLERILEIVVEGGHAAALHALVSDELVASLLVLHGLHPVDVTQRVEQALEHVRPYLGSHAGDVELVGVDAEGGVAHLRLQGSCDGCPSSLVTVRYAIEDAIAVTAPEVTGVAVEGVVDSRAASAGGPTLHQISSLPPAARADTAAGGWTSLQGLHLQPGQLTAAQADGVGVVVCSVG